MTKMMTKEEYDALTYRLMRAHKDRTDRGERKPPVKPSNRIPGTLVQPLKEKTGDRRKAEGK